MKKIIKIDGKDYTIQSSAYTQFKYKDETGRKFMQDLNKLTELRSKEREEILDDLDDFLEIILKITYVMILEADSKQVISFDDFLKNISNLFEEKDWYDEVIELAMSPISGGTQTSPQQFAK